MRMVGAVIFLAMAGRFFLAGRFSSQYPSQYQGGGGRLLGIVGHKTAADVGFEEELRLERLDEVVLEVTPPPAFAAPSPDSTPPRDHEAAWPPLSTTAFPHRAMAPGSVPRLSMVGNGSMGLRPGVGGTTIRVVKTVYVSQGFDLAPAGERERQLNWLLPSLCLPFVDCTQLESRISRLRSCRRLRLSPPRPIYGTHDAPEGGGMRN